MIDFIVLNNKRIIECSKFIFEQSNFEYWNNIFFSFIFIKIWNEWFWRFWIVIFVIKINQLWIQKTSKNCWFSIKNDMFTKLLHKTSKIVYVCDSKYRIFDEFDKNCFFSVDVFNIKNNKRKWLIKSDDDYN